MSGKQKTEGVRRIWDKYKFVALVALAGAVLLTSMVEPVTSFFF